MNQDWIRVLLPGERILWEGRPQTGLILRPIEFLLIPFSLMWSGFVLFWNYMVWFDVAKGSPLLSKVFGLPFLIAGLYIIIGRFFIDIWLRRELRYAVTDRRILIFRHGVMSKIKSLDISRLPLIEFNEQANGYGTIRFGAPLSFFGGVNLGIWQPTLDVTPQFLHIPNVRAVYDLTQRNSNN